MRVVIRGIMTKLTQHTPGPWAIRKYGNIQDDYEHTIPIKGVSLTSGKEAEANSILFAAAPEMLALLQESKDLLFSITKPFDKEAIKLIDQIDELLER